MAKSSSAPQLVEAYRLIKAGQRESAAALLKGYLRQRRGDAEAWWLLAHAVTDPRQQVRCLQEVLKLNPSHQPARATLARMSGESPTPTLKPTPAPDTPLKPPAGEFDEPDDSLILGGAPPITREAEVMTQPAAPARPPKLPWPGADLAADSPFEAAPAYDTPAASPFDGHAPSPVEPPAEAPAPSPFDLYDSSQLFDPAAHARLRPKPQPVQPAGSGGQPEWGPGLAYVTDTPPTGPLSSAAPSASGRGEDDRPSISLPRAREPERASVERLMVLAVVVVAVLVLVGIALIVASSQGWLGLGGEQVPAMATLDGGSFTIAYPASFDARCEREVSGYSVCGMANHTLYNEVDYFVGRQIDLAALIGDSLNMILTNDDLPEEQFSIIVMDVPPTSLSYDNGSWAKTKYELYQQFVDTGWLFDKGARVDYERQELTVEGRQAYYYRFTAEGQTKDAAWDVYVPHDGITLWLRIVYMSDRQHRLPKAAVEAMIASIHIKPVAEW